jgi:hypothetical protein
MDIEINDNRIDSMVETIWKFIRGDIAVQYFEAWIYSGNDVENFLGKSLYFDTISTNYSEKESVDKIKRVLSEFVLSFPMQKCQCIQLSDITMVDMGEDSQKVFQHFTEVKKRGKEYWWLSVHQCHVCNQVWLVASEERQNDIYCLHRLDDQSLEEIINNNQCPSYFDTYEILLRIGFEAGVSVSFVDPFESSLSWIIADLVRDNPQILISEIAKLLNLNIELAIELSKQAMKDRKATIEF